MRATARVSQRNGGRAPSGAAPEARTGGRRGARARGPAPAPPAPLDVRAIRRDFPILARRIYGRRLVYLDNAASTQKPRPVLDTMRRFYETDYSNIHRGVHTLSQRATEAYEGVRARLARWINARDPREVVFVRGTTEAINLVASSFGRLRIGEGDEIVVSVMEHHSNIVPWQFLCERTGALLRVAPIDDAGDLVWDRFEALLTPRTKLVALVHVSNALGTVNPARRIVEAAHSRGIPVLLDGAQAVAHERIDVQALDCDFYAFSAHKMYGPTGAGVLYGRKHLLEAMPPYQGGGDMIRSVTFERTTYNAVPHRFEAGTQSIADVVGLGAAVDYIEGIGLDAISAHERALLAAATERVSAVPGVRVIGTAREKAGILSFVIDGIHPHDIGTVLDREGIAIRAGHHCTQPLMARFGVPATARASFAAYNTEEDVDALVRGIHKVLEVFRA